ncbi:hypothetical protein [Apilactobacillus timberlakei]|uniref:hypothetical protein n=1 Tax=Apilactobacillus timberlakei TaxID=2008380 RepID=UPI001125F032|nr:hypothetical protein [Apilactobacillus timberlakei]
MFEIKLYGSFLFYLKNIFQIKKSVNFIFIVKSYLTIYFSLFLIKWFNNNSILESFSNKSTITFSGIIVTLIGSLLGILNFYKKSQNDKNESQKEQLYKLLDMLNSELEKNSKVIKYNILTNINKKLKEKLVYDDSLLQFISLNVRIKKKSFILYLYYLYFHLMLYFSNTSKYNKKDIKQLKKFINIINLFNIAQGSRARSIPSSSQEQYTKMLYSYIISNNNYYKRYLGQFIVNKNFQINPLIYKKLEEIGYIKYFSTFFPKEPKNGNSIWQYDVKYSYIRNFKIINKLINHSSSESLNNVCRYIHRIIKIINHMHISVDEKYSLYGLVRSSLDSDLLLAIYLNSTFSFKGSGLSRQLIGTSFFGDKKDINKSYSQHIDLGHLGSKDIKGLSKRILSNYYASYTYPGSVSFKKLFIKLMLSTKKIKKHL